MDVGQGGTGFVDHSWGGVAAVGFLLCVCGFGGWVGALWREEWGRCGLVVVNIRVPSVVLGLRYRCLCVWRLSSGASKRFFVSLSVSIMDVRFVMLIVGAI